MAAIVSSAARSSMGGGGATRKSSIVQERAIDQVLGTSTMQTPTRSQIGMLPSNLEHFTGQNLLAKDDKEGGAKDNSSDSDLSEKLSADGDHEDPQLLEGHPADNIKPGYNTDTARKGLSPHSTASESDVTGSTIASTPAQSPSNQNSKSAIPVHSKLAAVHPSTVQNIQSTLPESTASSTSSPVMLSRRGRRDSIDAWSLASAQMEVSKEELQNRRATTKDMSYLKSQVRKKAKARERVVETHLQSMLSLVAMFAAICASEIKFHSNEEVAIAMFKSVVTLVSCMQCWLLIRQRVAIMETMYRRGKADFAWSKKFVTSFVVELAVLGTHSPPTVDSSISITQLHIQAEYHWDHIATCFIMLRSYTLIRSLKAYLTFADDQVHIAAKLAKVPIKSTLFLLKYYMRETPFTLLALLFVSMLFVGSYIIRIAEMPYDRETHIYFWNSMWLLIVTSSTVGYGDITPNTHIGRFVAFTVLLLGLMLTSLLVAVFANSVTLNSRESRFVETARELAARNAQKQAAAIFVQKWYRSLSDRKSKHQPVDKKAMLANFARPFLKASSKMAKVKEDKDIHVDILVFEMHERLESMRESMRLESKKLKRRVDSLERSLEKSMVQNKKMITLLEQITSHQQQRVVRPLSRSSKIEQDQ